MLVEDSIKISVISDKRKLRKIEHQWNTLVGNGSKNPFLLSAFTEEIIDAYSNIGGYTPLIILIEQKQKIIGIVPLQIKRNFLGQRAMFFHPRFCSDLILDEQYRDICIKCTLDFLFKNLKCTTVNLPLSCSSPNLIPLKRQSALHKIHFKTTPLMGRKIILINSTRAKFEESLSRKFKKSLRRTERNLTKLGKLTKICVEGDEYQVITKKILSIEKKSWKEPERTHNGKWEMFHPLLVLNAAQRLSKIEPEFKWYTWFLELEGKTIAYLLVIEYKQVAYFVKTSYDDQYSKYNPGIIIQNYAINEQFAEGKNKYIDFLTDLSYMREWTDKCFPVYRVTLSKAIIPTVLQSFANNNLNQEINSRMFSFIARYRINQ